MSLRILNNQLLRLADPTTGYTCESYGASLDKDQQAQEGSPADVVKKELFWEIDSLGKSGQSGIERLQFDSYFLW